METKDLAHELTDQDRLLLVLSYLGPMSIFSLAASRKEFVKWHAKQGTLLSMTAAVLWVIVRGLYLLVRAKLWALLGALFWIAAGLMLLGLALTVFLCVVRALEGERFKIPVLGDLADAL